MLANTGLVGIHRENNLNQLAQGTREVIIGQRISNLPTLIGCDDQPTAP